MCLIFLSIKQHPKYKLVVAANRDEFYNRRTAPASYWNDYPFILGGRDLEASGTWLGLTKQGRLSMLTNYRDPKNINPKAPSRGQLVLDFLKGSQNAEMFMKELEPHAKNYNGFNLITGTLDELWYLSNYKEGYEEISPGLHGLSNHLLETPWPKVERGKREMESILSSPEIKKEDLFSLLYDDEIANDNTLPDTGIGLQRERALSSMFIKSPGYGTRCSTVILADYQNNVQFTERVFDLNTFKYTEQSFQFTVEN